MASNASHLRVTFSPAPPYSQAGYRDGKLYVDGIFGRVLEALADFVPFSYDIVYDHRLSFGVRLPNGSYTGIIGLLQSGAVDLAAAPVLLRYDRTEVATYAPVLFTSHCGLIAVAGEPTVWAVLLASIPVMSGALAFVEKRRPRTGGSFIWEMYENAWDILRSFTYEGNTSQTKSHSGRLLYSLWWLTVLVLTNGFAGQLKASMAIKTEPTRFRSADDVAQQPAIRPFIWKHTVYEAYVQTSGRPSLQALTRQVHRHGGFVPIADMLYVAPELLFTRFCTVAHSKRLDPELERRIHAKCVSVFALHI
ncbi:hypothetical protein HPB49_025645 [Dermacentor silvarum]|uniref:Uncharacterized protein n=1 Tax=Dermacentor silvarum TaxID=543639 RepID=A0ACB8D1H2_DERSI|nr:hypothetical protein HPB49_025645 [Dermacentor silvarum]